MFVHYPQATHYRTPLCRSLVLYSPVCTVTFEDIQNVHLSISNDEIVSRVDALPSERLAGCERTILDGASEVKFVQAGEDVSLLVEGSPAETKDVQYPIASSERYSSV